MNNFLSSLLLITLLCFSYKAAAKDSSDSLRMVNWHNKDPKADKAWGISTEKAYEELLKGKTSETIIVAVIDNGIDTNHEDLKDVIWINEDEIPNNGIDDDKNGYVDDIHGWNFLGNANGENISEATLEVTRLYKKYNSIFEHVHPDSIHEQQKDEYLMYKRIKKAYLTELTELEQEKAFFEAILAPFPKYDSIIANALNKTNYTLGELRTVSVEKKSVVDTAKSYISLLLANDLSKASIAELMKHFNSRLDYHFNLDFDSRQIIGDDVWTWNTTSYGNNDVVGANPDHGTTVAGIIGANRNNNLGIKGIANNVKIMCIRAVPDGDEWDKDVANAIEYAVDNGAQIINMSFGKEFSPQQEMVERVLKKASEKDVLLIHAAGNDNENNDVVFNYPRKYDQNGEVIIHNWISVGASGIKKSKKEFVANFTNYGKSTVDIFAPGVSILSCTPNNGYDFADGTSFAAPTVAGAAALIKSYHPSLSASEIKDIILASSETKSIKVQRPGTFGKKKKDCVHFKNLSVSGGLLNVYKALELAEQK